MSTSNIDDRLARLAPTSSPDPERLAAARSAVFDTTEDERCGSRRGRAHDGAHVVDLHDAPDDVVTPLGAARRRRNRHLGAAAAAAGVVGVVSVGIVLLPGEAGIFPASPESTCEDQLLRHLGPLPEDAEEPVWRTVASESTDTTDTTLLVLDGGGLAGACSEIRGEGGGFTSTATWSLPDVEPAADEILPRGITTGRAPVVWGVADANVTGVVVTHEWDHGTSRSVVEARVTDDGYWSAFFSPEDRIPQDAEPRFTWQLEDGTERSMALDEAWPGVDASTPLAEARREACGMTFPSSSPRLVLEEVRDDAGVTFLADGAGPSVLCLQDAGPPYSVRLASGGTTLEPETSPAEEEAVADYGGAGSRGAALVGRAGDDVARVQVTTTDGLPFDAEVVDGYWVVWGAALGSEEGDDPWQDATLRWYLTDGSPGGERTVFE
ncbi:hypothetical protein BCE75_11542 [Isoptericola sp. CG 20/1183]|uniref:DUF4179 domain-containing protein n=1 Tax=Isoptericola halotolerans TaxID=300560 RepID=A0ABX5EDX2_9MICO|nr:MULTISPECIES: hypothetical protein [Isoptericola]PRZ03074.1 hypothetical protein BCE75_11542 [Isoptericola sp. CG 20/1183]PRZ03328.1 hypothetical protein BCL65_11442 [Isoptericola halotolerans]